MDDSWFERRSGLQLHEDISYGPDHESGISSDVDPVSGIPKDILSLVLYCFFPMSHRHFRIFKGAYRLYSHYIRHLIDGKYIYSGSKIEYLCLPAITVNRPTKSKGDVDIKWTDDDVMMDIGWFKEIYDTMSLEIDPNKPVFCRVRHGKDWENVTDVDIPGGKEVLKGPYLNSAKINEKFRENATHDFSDPSTEIVNSPDSIAFTRISTTRTGRGAALYYHEDYLFCLPVTCHLQLIKDFLGRARSNRWPFNCIKNLDQLVARNIYIVPKPDQNIELGDLRWRLSFSVVEVELARSLTDVQRRCYRVLKAMIKYNINEYLPDIFKMPSYFLKTLMFWLCEHSPDASWIGNLGGKWIELLDNAIESLEKITLPMYFVPSYNLLDDKDPNIISYWKDKLRKIRQNPLEEFSKFWFKNHLFETEEYWGIEMSQICDDLHTIYRNIAGARSNELQKQTLQDNEFEAMINATVLTRLAGQYMLSLYSLEDFLKFMKNYPQVNELVDVSSAQNKEHLIWLHLNKCMAGMSEKSKIYPQWWTSLAEVTHHLALKFEDHNNPNNVLFSTEAAEKFHLIACSIQNEERNTMKFVKFCNFLMVQDKHEKAVKCLMVLCQKCPSNHDLYFSRVTSEVLDICLKLEVSLQDETTHPQRLFVYHFLTQSYIKAGVLTEVCIPDNIGSVTLHYGEYRAFVAYKYILLGYQLILCGNLEQAFQCFSHILNSDLQFFEIEPYNIKYIAMLYIISKVHQKIVLF